MAKIRLINSKYVLDYRIDDRRQRLSFESKLEAQKALQEIKTRMLKQKLGLEVSHGEHPVDIDLREVIYRYVESKTVNKHRCTQVNEKNYFERLYEYLSGIGVTKLDRIKLVHLEAYQAVLAKEVSPSTVNRHFRTIKNFFSVSVDWELIPVNPARKVKALRERPERRLAWTNEIFDLVMSELPQWCIEVLYFLETTGVRPVEAENLDIRDLDLENKIAICRSLKNSGSGERRVPLTENVVEFLRVIVVRAEKNKRTRPNDPVFINAEGRRFRPDNLQKVFARVRTRLGLPEGLQLYGLRHTFCTKLIRSGANINSVRKLMGHAKITTTMNYDQTEDDHLREVSRVIQREVSLAEIVPRKTK